MKYFDELKRSMTWLGKQSDTIFLGQAVEYPGTAMTNTLANVPKDKLLELPVAEEMQLGMSIGLALEDKIPISIYPRWNFLLLATNQLVNHLDKINKLSDGGYNPKVIIRTSIGSERPLHPQWQHVGDFTPGFRQLCENINIYRLEEPNQIFEYYKRAYESSSSVILVEYGDYYNEK